MITMLVKLLQGMSTTLEHNNLSNASILEYNNTFFTGFTYSGLPHTSNFVNLEDHNLVIKRHMKLKLFQAIKLIGTSCYQISSKSL